MGKRAFICIFHALPARRRCRMRGANLGEKLAIGEICSRVTVFGYGNMSVGEAARLMLEQHVGSLVIVEDRDAGRIVTGILTDRDITLAVVARDFNGQTMPVSSIMSANPACCRAEDSIGDALDLMRRHGVRRAPVVDGRGRLAGIIALDDLLRLFAEHLQNLAQIIDSEYRRDAHVKG
jgi:CBS domain-containing protein